MSLYLLFLFFQEFLLYLPMNFSIEKYFELYCNHNQMLKRLLKIDLS